MRYIDCNESGVLHEQLQYLLSHRANCEELVCLDCDRLAEVRDALLRVFYIDGAKRAAPSK